MPKALSLEPINVLLQGFEGTHQQTFKQDYRGLSRWSNVTKGYLKTKEEEAESVPERCDWDQPQLPLQVEGATSQGSWAASRGWKRWENRFSRSLQKRTALLTPWFQLSETYFRLLTSRVVRQQTVLRFFICCFRKAFLNFIINTQDIRNVRVFFSSIWRTTFVHKYSSQEYISNSECIIMFILNPFQPK